MFTFYEVYPSCLLEGDLSYVSVVSAEIAGLSNIRSFFLNSNIINAIILLLWHAVGSWQTLSTVFS